jgi:hypothetical protein
LTDAGIGMAFPTQTLHLETLPAAPGAAVGASPVVASDTAAG